MIVSLITWIPSTYRTRHVDPSCSCPMLSIPYDKLVDIANSGQVPLISIAQAVGSNPPYRFQLVARSASSKYIAISHVWSDGLGNPRENALPLCQVKILHRMVNSLHAALGENTWSRFKRPVSKKTVSFLLVYYNNAFCIRCRTDDLNRRQPFSGLTHYVCQSGRKIGLLS